MTRAPTEEQLGKPCEAERKVKWGVRKVTFSSGLYSDELWQFIPACHLDGLLKAAALLPAGR